MGNEEVVLMKVSYRAVGFNDGWPDILECGNGRRISNSPAQLGLPVANAILEAYMGSDKSGEYEVVLRRTNPTKSEQRNSGLDKHVQ
jgi:hypothetical protein